MKTIQKDFVAWVILAIALAVFYDGFCHQSQFSLTGGFSNSSLSTPQ